MNILQIFAMGRLYSGGAHQMIRLSNALVKKGHQVTVVIHADPQVPENEVKEYFDPAIHFIRLPLPKVKPNPETIRAIIGLRKFIRKNQFDIIHAHKGRATDYALLSSLGFDIPIVANRGVTNPLNWLNALKYRTGKIQKIIAVSEAVKKVLIETGNIPPDKIEVVFGSVDVEQFHPDIRSTFRNEFHIPADRYVIGFVGNAGERKGLPYVIEAFREYRKSFPDDMLVIIGVDPSLPINQELKEEFGSSVIVTPYRKDIPNCMKAMNMFVFAGIKEEGLTGTVREAAAMQLPIVCTDVAGNRELIRDRETGILVPKKNSKKLLEAMLYLRNHPEEAHQLARNARKLIEETMSNEVRVERILKIYEECISGYPNPSSS
jgi:glycosyltransferase involved in cell wall biosynthesis